LTGPGLRSMALLYFQSCIISSWGSHKTSIPSDRYFFSSSKKDNGLS
jgi:hypothetical protein